MVILSTGQSNAALPGPWAPQPAACKIPWPPWLGDLQAHGNDMKISKSTSNHLKNTPEIMMQPSWNNHCNWKILRDLPNARECPDEQRNSRRTASMEHARQTSHSTWSSPTQAPNHAHCIKSVFQAEKGEEPRRQNWHREQLYKYKHT